MYLVSLLLLPFMVEIIINNILLSFFLIFKMYLRERARARVRGKAETDSLLNRELAMGPDLGTLNS